MSMTAAKSDLSVKTVGILLFLSGILTCQGKKLYGAKGHSIVLPLKQLPDGTKVASVIWKHDKDKAAEWEEGDEEPTYYGIFNSTTTLDMDTWALTISNLQPHFRGKYSAQMNHMDPTETLNLVEIDPVYLYRVKGQSITLKPEVPNTHVRSVEWALNNTVIALWDEGGSSSYRNLLLDNTTFYLTILDPQPNDTGLYTFALNQFETAISYLLTVKDTVLELSIIKECNSTTCTLNCMGADNENIEVSWIDNKGREESGPVLVVERSPHLNVTYTCSSDSGSWKTRSISEIEFFLDISVSVSEDAKRNLEMIMLTIVAGFGLALFGVTAAILFWTRKVRNGRGLHLKDQQPHQQKEIERLQINDIELGEL